MEMDQTTEIFDDVYLGLHAGAAARKRKRGEHLSEAEHEALGRWERLSTARKTAAIGAFAGSMVSTGLLSPQSMVAMCVSSTPASAKSASSNTCCPRAAS